MPVFQEIKNNETHILIWKYEEGEISEDENLLNAEEWAKMKDFRQKRQREFWAVRKVLKTILPSYHIHYQENGEPYLQPSDKFISISHSFPLVAVAVSSQKIGIDLEKNQEKISKLKPRFLHQSEYSWVENEKEQDFLTAIWSIKESLYKIHPKKYWSFREHYEVFPFDFSDMQNIRCRVFDDEKSENFTASVHRFDEFYLTIVQ